MATTKPRAFAIDLLTSGIWRPAIVILLVNLTLFYAFLLALTGR